MFPLFAVRCCRDQRACAEPNTMSLVRVSALAFMTKPRAFGPGANPAFWAAGEHGRGQYAGDAEE